MTNIENWHSGWSEYKKEHPNMNPETYMFQLNKHENNFNKELFIQHYNNLSNEEWKKTINTMKLLGYDIRSILHYKDDFEHNDFAQKSNAKFSIDAYPEIIIPLMEVDGCIEFPTCNQPTLLDEYEMEQERQNIIQNYQRFDLPIPKYWKELLW